MNWYEHHIGDYDKNTSHLTACEDGIYSRLIRRYYDKEVPLPSDVSEVKRLARARTREERAAVEAILREFFREEPDGWHHKTIDEAIAAFKAGEPEREAKKKNEDTRLARHRAERAELFGIINAAGQHLPYNAPIGEVRALVERIRTGTAATPPAPVSGPAATAPETPPATAPATPATATHPPPTTSHPPEDLLSGGAAPPPAPTPAPTAPPPAPTEPPKAKKPAKAPADPAPTTPVWEAYLAAWMAKYPTSAGAAPQRNATINGQLQRLVNLVGAELAPKLAAFYLTLPMHGRNLHPIGELVSQWEGIRARYLTNIRDAVQPAAAPTAREQRMHAAMGSFAGRILGARAPTPSHDHLEDDNHVAALGNG